MNKSITNLKMKNVFLSFIVALACILHVNTAFSQVSTYYVFSQNTGTYTPISGGVAIATATNHTTSADVSLDQGNYAGTIPFNFNFNGTNYTSFNANGNGYITFGATLPTTSASTPISATVAYNGAVAAMARDIWGVYGSVGTRTSGSPTITAVTDFTGIAVGKPIRGTGVATGALVSAFDIGAGTITMSANATSTSSTYIGWPTGEIRVETIGVAPNRICVIQYSGMSDFATTAPTGHIMQWQIQLAEGGGVASNQTISIVYGPQTNLSTTSRTQQVGLRGATNADYNNRTSTTDWSATTAGTANSSLVTRTNVIYPASGLTFVWSPPSVCNGTPTAGTASASTSNICAGGTSTLSLTGYSTGSTGITFQWQESSTSGGPYTNVTGGIGATNPNYTTTALTSNKFYICQVTCSNSAQSVNSNQVTINVNNPQIISTNSPQNLCGIGTVTFNANVSSGSTANWYAASSGGSPLYSGTSFTTPVISTSTNYYVAAGSGGFTGNVGKTLLESTASGTGGGLATYMNFDALSNFDLQTVVLYPYGATDNVAGTVTIELRSSTGTPIMSQTVNVVAHNSFATSVPQVVTLNFPVTGGASYRLGVSAWTGGVSNLWRDATGTYPYTLPGVVSITGPSTTPYYYFFYNWGVSTGCEGPRQMVTASVVNAPLITASTTQSLVCSGGATTLNVSSSNDPDYTYSWTSSPSGFNASGASVNANPAINTTYTVTALDNTAGPYSGCTTISTVDITAQPSSATVTGSPESICGASGSAILGLIPTGIYPVGSIQWQSSPNGSGYIDIGGATNETYSTGTISSTTFYKALIKDGNNNVCISPFKEIVVGVPTVNSTTPNTRCGTGTTTLQATGSSGSTIKWYATSTGGSSIGTGSPFTTPVINNTTTYYAAAETGSGAPVNVVVGTGAGTSATYSNPFYSLWSNTHNQHLILASELIAAGVDPGIITHGGINITVAGTLPMIDFSLKLANTSVTNLSSYASATFTTVYTSASLMPVVGINTVAFSTPFIWDGVSNLLIEICHGNSASTATMSRTCKTDATSFVSSIHTHTTTAPGTAGSVQCTNNTSNVTTYSVRPQFYFTVIPSCSSARTPVTATVTPAPPITAAATALAVCPGGSSDLSVSSPNDPSYTYIWTSVPAGFNASGAGPHTVSPSVNTKYFVTATDNSGGPNQNCALIDSLTIINGGTLVAGTISTPQTELCLSGATTLTLTGASGGANQWQSSTLSATGPWTNVGTGSNTYNTGTISQTTYYQVVTSCNSSSVTSNVQTVTVNNPSITGTTPATRCGTGTSTLQAIGSAGTTIKWYTANSGGLPVGTGNSFITPVISTSTSYYAAAELGSGGPAVNAVGAGATTSITYPCPFYSLWSNTHNQYLILASELLASGISPGAMTALGVDISSAGTLPVIDLSLKMGHTSATSVSTFLSPTFTTVYTSASLMPTTGTNTMTFSTPFVWDGVNNIVIEVCHGNSGSSATMSRTGDVDNTSFISTIHTHKSAASAAAATCSDLTTNLTTYSIRPKFTFTYESGCASPRTAVLATVNPAPAIALVADDLSLCTGGSTNISVTSSNDPNYTYTWTSVPAGFNQTGNGPFTISPSVNTKYFVSAIDNSAGPNNSCVISDSVNVIVTGTLVAGTVSASQTTYCLNGTPTLTLTGAQGAIQWQSSTVSATGPWTNVGTGLTTYSPALNQTTYIQAEVSCQSSNLISNVETITVYNPQILSTTPDSRCGAGSLNLAATATPGSVVNWYSSSIGGAALASGNTFVTPVIGSTTTFYAASTFGGGGTVNTAMPAALSTATSGVGTTNFGLVFDAISAFTINSVTVYPVSSSSASGTVTVDIINSSGTVLHTTTVNVVGGPAASAPAVVIPLNFNILPGTNLKMRPNFTGISGLLFEPSASAPSGNYGFPYVVPGVLSINHSTLTAAPANTVRLDLYYYFYNWSIATGCEGNRVPVIATVTSSPAISASATYTTPCSGNPIDLSVSSSNAGYTYSWTSTPAGFNGTGAGPLAATPAVSTTYQVLAIDNSGGAFNGCGALSTVTVTPVANPLSLTVTSTPGSVCVGDNAQLTSVASAVGYTMNTNCGTGFIDIASSGTSITGLLDDSEHNITIPAFTFNGISYTTARLGMNGVIAFGSTSGEISVGNTALPTTGVAAGNIFLAPYWDDLDINLGATVKTQTIGNVYIIQWTNTDHNLFTTGGITFQVQMNLVTGVITYVYPDVIFGSATYDAGLTATIGIQFSSTSAIEYSFNTASLTNGQCISFTPNTPNITYDWTANSTYLSATNIANPVAQGVMSTQNYSLLITDLTSGCTKVANYTLDVIPLPQPTASSNSPVCEGQSVSFFGNNTTSGQTTGNGYVWSGPNGFNDIVQNPTLSNATAAASGTYTVTVTNQFGCTETTTTSVTVAPLPALNIQSQTNVSCNGGFDGAFTIEVTNGSGFYLYDQNGNINFDGIFTGFSAGLYIVQVTDGNSCASSIPVTITEPDPTTLPDAGQDQTSCVGATVTLAGNTAAVGTGTWTVVAGSGTFTNANDPATTVTGVGAGLNTYAWTIDNAVCFISNSDNVNVTTNVLPTATVSGTTSICNGQTANLTLDFTGTGPWTYSYSNGSTTFGPFATSNNPEIVQVSPTVATTYSLVGIDDSNCSGTVSGSASITVVYSPPVGSIYTFTAPTTACFGTIATITTNAVSGATSYTWSGPAGTLFDGQPGPYSSASNSVSVEFGILSTTSGYSICATAVNACGQSNTRCIWIRGTVSTPAPITGSTVGCPNTTGPYSTSTVVGAANYFWTASPQMQIIAGQGTPNVTVRFLASFTSGTICVVGVTSCGSTSTARCMTVNKATSTPGTMSGPFAQCPGQTGQVFSIDPVAGAASYTWTVPANVTLTSGQGTPSITVSVGSTFNIGNICVTATSICGIVSAPRCKTISSVQPNTPGNITGPNSGVCGQSITYSVPAQSGVTSYDWVLPVGATIVGGAGTNTVQITFASNFTTGQLCVTAENGCGSSTARCVNIKGVPADLSVITGPNPVCSYDAGLLYYINPAFGATSYVWTVPAGASIVAGQGTNAIIIDYGIGGGLITVKAVNGCGQSGTRTLNVIVNCRMAGSLPNATLNAYPNPVSSDLTIDLDATTSGSYVVELLDLSGRIVKSEVMNAIIGLNRNSMDVSTLSKGMYMLNVKNENGFSQQLRIAVE